ncbi:unnamed protein product, partial [Ectocarpus sp. 12 AP-2014]
ERVQGRDHPDVASALNNRAGLLYKQGKYSEAEPLHVRAIAIGEKVLGPEHPDLAVWLNNRARLLRKCFSAISFSILKLKYDSTTASRANTRRLSPFLSGVRR